MKEQLTLKLLKERYGVIRLEKDESIPTWVFVGEFYSITKTEDELSIVCLEKDIQLDIKNKKCETDWRILKIEGPLNFSLIGILSKISTLMANNNISIFAISTYDTDYILIKENKIKKAINTLMTNGYKVFNS
ncbi:ACT domain-containing protein [Sarcina ventriculi]|uniref:ACT domain-containing protein n=1 Tax=Sarcina ventriculi TaxID=1267 RepID=UPI00073E36B0|nr:ACT domain-containing protein [Sarcina ventriculi]